MKWGFEHELGLRRRARCLCHMCQDGGPDQRLEPVKGDWIDELVNEQLARGGDK